MKNFFALSCILFAFSNSAKGQSSAFGKLWCAPGAQWHWHSMSFSTIGYAELTFVSDTFFEGRSCHKIVEHVRGVDLQTFNIYEVFNSEFTYEDNGVVYAYGTDVYSGSHWDTLYNFNANPGDKWHLFEAWSNAFVEVLDTGHRNIQGYYLRWLTIKYPPGTLAYTDTIFERIGCIGFNYPFTTSVLTSDPAIANFCNYSDNDFPDWPNPDAFCTELPTGIDEVVTYSSVSIFPNPNSGNFEIQPFNYFKGSVNVTVIDVTGRKIRQQQY